MKTFLKVLFSKQYRDAKKWAIIWNWALLLLPGKGKYYVKYVRNVHDGKYINR